MSSFKKASHALVAFAYTIFAVSPVMADDSEIYLAGNSGTTGSPNAMLLIDTSGSMKYDMATTDSEDIALENQRITHLKNAVEKILDTLPGNIRVGLARYNENNKGGRIIYPLTALDAAARDDGTGYSKFSYRLPATGDDVDQLGLADGTTLKTSSSALSIGGGDESSYAVAAASDTAVECNGTAVARPYIFIGAAGSADNGNMKKGLYLGNHPLERNNAYCESSLGLRFTSLGIASTAAIASAKLVFTHSRISNNNTRNRNIDGGYDNTYGPDSAEELDIKISVENAAAPVKYEAYTAVADAAKGVVARSYVTSTVVNANIPEDDFTTADVTYEVDVTKLMQNRRASVTGALGTVAFRIQGMSGGAGDNAPKIRRIYGSDGGTKAPKLVISLQKYNDDGRNVGVRFQGLGIPQNAQVQSAYIQMTAAADSDSGSSTIRAFIDNTGTSYIDSNAFSSSSHLGTTARWGTSATTTTTAWEKDSAYNIDVTSLVAAQVQNANYCGGSVSAGNAKMGFKLQLVSGSVRTAYSSEGNASAPPKLVVRYAAPTTPTTCVRTSRMTSSSEAASNYAVQGASTESNTLGGNINTAGAMRFTGTTGMTSTTNCSSNCVALRFPAIDIPKNAVITKVVLSLVGANDKTGNVRVRAVATNDRGAFTASGKITSMSLLAASTGNPASADLAIPGTLVGASSYGNLVRHEMTSDDLRGVIQNVVNQTDWARGNSLGLILGYTGTASQDNRPTFYTTANESRYPRLTITFRSTDPADARITAREDMLSEVNALVPSNSTPLNGSYYETALYMRGETAKFGRAYLPKFDASWKLYDESAPAMTTANVYQSPVAEAACQSNNIIALTDGIPVSDQTDVMVVADTDPNTPDSCTDHLTCMQMTASYLKNVGRNGYPIKTHTIGFGPVAGSRAADGTVTLTATGTALQNIAIAGDGKFFAAADSDALLAGFQTIFSGIIDSNGAMAAPGVAVSQTNRSQHLDQLYYGVFKPKTSLRWPGNLKRYKLGTDPLTGRDAVLDVNGNAAVGNDKFFKDTAKSWWSADADGNEAAEGGVAGKQTSAITVYTNSGTSMGVLNAASPPAAMGTGTTAAPNNNVRWLQGIDVDNENAGGNGFRQSMGAPVHAQPTLVSYGSGDENFAVFVGTNDGLLYSINANSGSGVINWAWLPESLQSAVATLRANPAISADDAPQYGLDASWTLATIDSSTRLLVGGMRQGGSSYFALQLPSTQTGAPIMKWTLSDGTGGVLDGAKTWSQPVFGRVRVGTTIEPVFVFGGGLDNDKYEVAGAGASATVNSKGNKIYIVKALTGVVLATISTSQNSEMKYSIPGSPRLIDKNGDGLFDHIYYGDTGGQLFRADIDNRANATSLVGGVALLAKLGVSADTGKENDRRFYETPAVAYVQDTDGIYAAIVIGTGNRNFPKSDRAVTDRVYMIKDYDAGQFGLATRNLNYVHSNLDDLTNSSTLTANKKGWYISMTNEGEKVLSSPFIFSKQVTDSGGNKTLSYNAFFNTFQPLASSTGCSPVAGATYAWSVNLFNATASFDRNANGTIDSSDRKSSDKVVNGISGSDVGLIRAGQLKRVTGTGTEDAGAVPDGFNQIQRTRWFDNPNVTR